MKPISTYQKRVLVLPVLSLVASLWVGGCGSDSEKKIFGPDVKKKFLKTNTGTFYNLDGDILEFRSDNTLAQKKTKEIIVSLTREAGNDYSLRTTETGAFNKRGLNISWKGGKESPLDYNESKVISIACVFSRSGHLNSLNLIPKNFELEKYNHDTRKLMEENPEVEYTMHIGLNEFEVEGVDREAELEPIVFSSVERIGTQSMKGMLMDVCGSSKPSSYYSNDPWRQARGIKSYDKDHIIFSHRIGAYSSGPRAPRQEAHEIGERYFFRQGTEPKIDLDAVFWGSLSPSYHQNEENGQDPNNYNRKLWRPLTGGNTMSFDKEAKTLTLSKPENEGISSEFDRCGYTFVIKVGDIRLNANGESPGYFELDVADITGETKVTSVASDNYCSTGSVLAEMVESKDKKKKTIYLEFSPEFEEIPGIYLLVDRNRSLHQVYHDRIGLFFPEISPEIPPKTNQKSVDSENK